MKETNSGIKTKKQEDSGIICFVAMVLAAMILLIVIMIKPAESYCEVNWGCYETCIEVRDPRYCEYICSICN